MDKTYMLMGSDGVPFESETPGEFGGNGADKIYGRLDCPTGARAAAVKNGPYRKHRVFFADESTAIAAGFRPCGACMQPQYAFWKYGPQPGLPFPWRKLPRAG
jgi:hypothetical protein